MFQSFIKRDWKNSNPHLLLLSKFIRPHGSDDFLSERWAEVLGEQALWAISKFQKDGYLQEASLSEKLDYKYIVSDLKAILKEKGLKHTGNKGDLIERLITADQSGMQDSVNGLSVWILSSIGNSLAEEFITYLETERGKAEAEVLTHLKNKRFREASSCMAAYEARQVFPRGIGIDWTKYDTKQDEKILTYIFTQAPKLINGTKADDLEHLRVAAGLKYLWGNPRFMYLGKDFQTKIHLDAQKIATMLWFHANYLQELDLIT